MCSVCVSKAVIIAGNMNIILILRFFKSVFNLIRWEIILYSADA